MIKDTVGKIATDLLVKADDNHSVVDQMEENLTDFEKNIIECAERGLKVYNSDFFVVVLTKKERLLDNVLRNYYVHRKSCPTPDFDQIVYQYLYDQDALKIIWVIPNKEMCKEYLEVVTEIKPEERQLAQYVLDFADGTLDRLCRKLNKEKGDTQFLQDKLFKIN